jgi:uncharacterized Zn finger protein
MAKKAAIRIDCPDCGAEVRDIIKGNENPVKVACLKCGHVTEVDVKSILSDKQRNKS